MHLDTKTLNNIAKLARLKFSEKELSQFKTDLNQILTWVEQLQEIDTKNVEPLKSVNLDAMPLRNDKVTDGDIADKILANAPEKDFDMFSVPKVVE